MLRLVGWQTPKVLWQAPETDSGAPAMLDTPVRRCVSQRVQILVAAECEAGYSLEQQPQHTNHGWKERLHWAGGGVCLRHHHEPIPSIPYTVLLSKLCIIYDLYMRAFSGGPATRSVSFEQQPILINCATTTGWQQPLLKVPPHPSTPIPPAEGKGSSLLWD